MLLTEYDYATDMEVQREEAMRIGEERGIEQGLQQGEYQKALEAAKKALALGVSPEVVSNITGLSLEEIARL